uniref:Uncharacterized protein n=1 Tax=Panagrolaimus sp. JU765 TaxID=591449 RepID=A0AC34RA35_9BILA
MNRRRQGMFHNAKFSDRIIREIPPSTAREIQKDVAFVMKKDKSQEIRQWNRAPAEEEDISESQLRISSHRILRGGKPTMIARPYLGYNVLGKNDGHDRHKKDAAFKTASDVLRERQGNNAIESSSSAILVPETEKPMKAKKNLTTTFAETPTVFKTPPMKKKKVEKVPEFPDLPNMEEISKGILEGLPHLSLKNDDKMSYAAATNGILRKALSQFFNLKTFTRKSAAEIRMSQSIPLDPEKEMMNQTAPLVIRKNSVNSTFFNSKILKDESPTKAIENLDDSEITFHSNVSSNAEDSFHGYHEVKEDFQNIDRTLVDDSIDTEMDVKTLMNFSGPDSGHFSGGSAVEAPPFSGFFFNDNNLISPNSVFKSSFLNQSVYATQRPAAKDLNQSRISALELFPGFSQFEKSKDQTTPCTESSIFAGLDAGQPLQSTITRKRKPPEEGSAIFSFL